MRGERKGEGVEGYDAKKNFIIVRHVYIESCSILQCNKNSTCIEVKGSKNSNVTMTLIFPKIVWTRPLNVYCPECPPGGTIGHPGGQQKKFLPFGHGMDLAAFNGTDLQNKSFQDRAEISKA